MTLLNNCATFLNKRFSSAAIAIVAINHIIGLTGLNTPAYQSVFESLTYINLLISFTLVFLFQKPFNNRFFLFVALSFTIGMGAEICGVNTGLPFGIYHYNKTLGPEIWGVPLIIGLNWVLLGYVCGVAVGNYFASALFRIISASLLMVIIDMFLEGFAIRHHFWAWQNFMPPLSNFISWFFISGAVQLFFAVFIRRAPNPVAIGYLVVLIVFLLGDFILNQAFRTFY